MHIAALYGQRHIFNYLNLQYKDLKMQTDKFKKFPREYKQPYNEMYKSHT